MMLSKDGVIARNGARNIKITVGEDWGYQPATKCRQTQSAFDLGIMGPKRRQG